MKTKVALFVNGWNGENVDSFIEGFNGYFTNAETDLFVFTSFTTSVDNTGIHDAENAIYALPDVSFFDVVIIFGAGIKSESAIASIIERCKKTDVPVILQGVESDEVSTVTVDNYVGMKNLCSHLIENHGVKNVVYIAGTSGNYDSNYRMDVLKETLEEHGYCFNKENVFYANWEASKIRDYLVENYGDNKNKLPDAFVCANDQMAMFAVLFLEHMGYMIPNDIIVTGFDNLSDGKVCYPSLATVDQSYQKQGNECAKLVTELIDNKKIIKKCVIPCSAVMGESCGCNEFNGETELRKKLGRIWWSERYFSDNMQVRELQFDMCFMANEKYEDIHQSMNNDFLTSTGEETEDFHIYVNPQYKELEYMKESVEYQEICFNPVMDTICARTDGVIHNESTLDIRNLFLGYNANGKGKIYVFKSLVIDSYVAGYMVTKYTEGAFKRRQCFEFANNVNKTLEKYQKNIDDYNKTIRIQEQANEFLRQTVEALATAVDAKDSYTNGHSNRVAKYARKIAEEAGMTEAECDDVYLAGLLHDVGKIGIDDRIINKKGKLTAEEFDAIKLHPVLGGQILSKIVESHSLSIGARYHHERYDGNGYPDRLKGEDIPRIARIIGVADAYDAMTSKRSYRDMIPRMYVREELVKGIGTQFDPKYAKIMIHLLDNDDEYTMRERQTEEVFGSDLHYMFGDYKTNVSAGVRITNCPLSLKIKYKPLRNGGQPTLLFYDAADTRYYLEDNTLSEEMDFVEFASVDINGNVYPDYVRKVEQNSSSENTIKLKSDMTYTANVFVVKQEDHFLVRIESDERTDEIVFAMYDASRFLYLALAGEFCELDIIDVDISTEEVKKDYIPRIAEKISYIDGLAGDIPNVQIDGWISSHSDIIPIDSDIEVDFHAMSLPSARRVWHCPIIAVFSSDDGQIGGANYKELAFIRLDGEVWCDNSDVVNEALIAKQESFENWSIWKQKNKAGVDCKLKITRKRNAIALRGENCGLEIKNRTIIPEDVSNIYFYLTGDQCALTDIRIIKK